VTSSHVEVPNSSPYVPSLISVLVLDDQRFDRHKINRLCATLPMQCDISHADSLSALNTLLDNAAFDLVLVDYGLPDGDGIDALEMIRLSPRNCNAASIMVTGFDEESIAFEAMTRGCADYITKDELSPGSFERAVTNALQKSVLSTEIRNQTFARAEVESVLQRLASQCVTDIKPMVSRMIRQLRDLRDAPMHDASLMLSRRESVETSCLHLWGFLEELEKHHAGEMMRDLAAKRPLSLAAEPAPSLRSARSTVGSRPPTLPNPHRSKRPPSPFSRPSQ